MTETSGQTKRWTCESFPLFQQSRKWSANRCAVRQPDSPKRDATSGRNQSVNESLTKCSDQHAADGRRGAAKTKFPLASSAAEPAVAQLGAVHFGDCCRTSDVEEVH